MLNKERNGHYLGETVQVIPHITNEIRDFIYSVGNKTDADIVITEVGGTTGDIESLPFLEAIRQLSHEVERENCLFVHVTYVPYLQGSNEHKSKPTQHSVKALQSLGIMPNIIVTRSDEPIDEDIKQKIALFCNVKRDCVIENITLPILYEAPLMLEEQNFSKMVCRELGIESHLIDLSDWRGLVSRIKASTHLVKVALVGKYVKLHDAYLSVVEALAHAGYDNGTKVEIEWIDAENINKDNIETLLKECSGILIPGGFGSRGIEGKLLTAEYARVNNIPYLGICLGMQIAVIEYARNVLGYKDADSREFNKEAEHLVIDLLPDQHEGIAKGGTMRLGAYPCKIKVGSKLEKAYEKTSILERHRHRYEVNNLYRRELEEAGLYMTGTSPNEYLVEAVEVSENDFYIGVQYHPEFKSRPNRSHPLFKAFITASLRRAKYESK